MSDLPTPRTSEQLSVNHWNTYCLNEREGTEYVRADFAKTLERELMDALERTRKRTERIHELDGICHKWCMENAALNQRAETAERELAAKEKENAELKEKLAHELTTSDMLAEALKTGYMLKETTKRYNDSLANKSQGITFTMQAQLTAKLDEARKDADRYEWIVENAIYLGGGNGGTYSFDVELDSESMSEQIDQAIAAQKINASSP